VDAISGIVHKSVEPAAETHGFRDHVPHVVFTRDVGGDRAQPGRLARLGQPFGCGLVVSVGHDDGHAVLPQPLCDAATDALRTAGDDPHASGEVTHVRAQKCRPR
jgi:hypothetical protein